jgi:hypothetical protein
MERVITSYLLSRGSCAIPGIGLLEVKNQPAELDVASQLLLPPQDAITLVEQSSALEDESLISYIAACEILSEAEARKQLNVFAADLVRKTKAGEHTKLPELGIFSVAANGKLQFRAEGSTLYFKPVKAERVIYENVSHDVLVGDNQTTSDAMTKYYNEQPKAVRPLWYVWSAIFALIAIAAIIYHFSDHPFSAMGIGNSSLIPVVAPRATHVNP